MTSWGIYVPCDLSRPSDFGMLNGADIVHLFEEMGGKTVAHREWTEALATMSITKGK